MGLTSGQGRLLMLTSRLSDIQLDEMLISQRKTQLAWQSEKVAKEYNEKTTNMKLVMKVNDSTEKSGYRKTDLTYSDMTSMGYLVTDANNKIYLTKNASGDWIIPTADNRLDTKIFDGDIATDANGKSTISIHGKSYEIVDGTELISDKTKLQNNLMNGMLYVMNTSEVYTGAIELNNLESNTGFEWVYDTSDDAEAESKYNYQTAQISRQDNLLDIELQQLETQHQAVAKELESVQKLIDDNVKRTFNLFSD